MNHPRLSIIFSSLHPPFLLPSPFENSPRSRSNFVLYVSSAGERGKRRDRKEHPANIVEKFVPRFPHPFHGKWRYVPVYFKFSPRNFGFVPRLDCLPPPSPFYSLPRRHLVPTIFPHYPPNLLSIRAKRTNETTRRRFATRQKILRYFAGTIFLFYFKHSDKTPLERGSRGRLKYLKKRGVVVQRQKARVRNKNTFERKFKVDYLAAQDYTLRPASLVISRDKRREERRETY